MLAFGTSFGTDQPLIACRIRDNPEVGKPLLRELAGYRSVRVGGENRLVYKHDRDEDECEVLAIERRRDDKAYDVAVKRL